MRAYILAGKPTQNISPYGSFEEWSDLVRSVLVWTGEPDPCEGRGTVEADADNDYEKLRDLLFAWADHYPPTPSAQTYVQGVPNDQGRILNNDKLKRSGLLLLHDRSRFLRMIFRCLAVADIAFPL